MNPLLNIYIFFLLSKTDLIFTNQTSFLKIFKTDMIFLDKIFLFFFFFTKTDMIFTKSDISLKRGHYS